MYDGDRAEEIFKYIGIKKELFFLTPYFIIPAVPAVLNFVLAAIVSYPVSIIGLITGSGFLLAAVIAVACVEYEKKTARKECSALLAECGEEDVYADFSQAAALVDDKVRIGDKYIFLNHKIVKVSDAVVFDCYTAKMKFVPISRVLQLTYIKNGKKRNELVEHLSYFSYKWQLEELNNKLARSKMTAQDTYYNDVL